MTIVGVFGGSFNPPHVGHVLATAYALSVARVERVVVVPVFRHPFSKELAPFEDRMAMCELAFEVLPKVTVSDVERELGGESLTLRTVTHLAEVHPGWSLRLLIGSDVVPDLPKWHRWDRISEIAPPVVFERAGATLRPDRALLPEISSTDIRALFARGDTEDVDRVVPARVASYVRARGLYGVRCEASSS